MKANVIAGWVVHKRKGTLFSVDEYTDACHQFQVVCEITLQ